MGWVDHRIVFRCSSCNIRFLVAEPHDRVFAWRLSRAAQLAEASAAAS
jgi:hypothetical protein